MSYQLGIDLGTTYTAAAVCRASDGRRAAPEMATLGGRTASVASVLFLGEDGSLLVGEAAERRAVTDPDRVVREFKRQIGDVTPLVVGGQPHAAPDLAARLVRWVVDLVTEREGGGPERIAVTHPASWGAHKKQLLGRSLTAVGVEATFLAEPRAAALSYASAERVEPGSLIAVYDLGGGTFDAAVVRKAGAADFELLGRAEGIENFGGVDFDEAVFEHVRGEVGDALDDLDPADPHALSAVARLRRECVEAKEALSSDTEATIPVLLPELRTAVRLGRSEFEAMIRGGLEETVEALREAVVSAGLTPADLTAVLLVGGSSRIPLVSQLVSAELGRPVAVDADPKNAIAMGAALAVSPRQTAPVVPPVVPPPVSPPAAPPVSSPVPPPPVSLPRPLPSGPSAAPVGAGYVGAAGAAASAPFADWRVGGRAGGAQPPTARLPPAVEDVASRSPRRPPALMMGVGGVAVVAAIAAALVLWNQQPTTSVDPAGGSDSSLVPQTPTPAVPDPGSRIVVPDAGPGLDAPDAEPRVDTPAEAPPETVDEVVPTTVEPPPTTEEAEPTTEEAQPVTEDPPPPEEEQQPAQEEGAPDADPGA